MLSILTCSHWSVNINIICGQPTSYCTASADKSNDWLGLHKLPYTSLHSSQKGQIPAACADNWIITNTFPTKTTRPYHCSDWQVWLITSSGHIGWWTVALIIHRCSLYHCPVQLTLIFEVSRQQTSSPEGCCPSLELLKSTVLVGLI